MLEADAILTEPAAREDDPNFAPLGHVERVVRVIGGDWNSSHTIIVGDHDNIASKVIVMFFVGLLST